MPGLASAARISTAGFIGTPFTASPLKSRETMSGTLISSLVWVPRGRAAERPKKYQLDEGEIERVGKLGGPGVLEQLKNEMAAVEDGDEMEGGDDEGDWEDEDEEDGNAKAENDDDDDEKMDEDKEPEKPFDPNDLSAFKMDEYDEEESKGVGKPL